MLGNICSMIHFSFTFDPGSVDSSSSEEETVTVPGLKTTDFVIVSKPTVQAGLVVGSARVSADDTLTVTIGNCSGSAVDESSETWYGIAFRPAGTHEGDANQP